MKIYPYILTLFLIAFTSITFAQDEYPKITLIDRDTVVIWLLEQDKSNSRIIEKGFQYSKDNQLLQKDTFHLREALRVQVGITLKRDSILLECHERYGREIIAKNLVIGERDHWKGKYFKEKTKTFVGKWIVRPLLFVGGVFLGYQSGTMVTK